MVDVDPHIARVQRDESSVRRSSSRPDQLRESPGASSLLTAGLSAERATVGGELFGARGVEGEPRSGEGAQLPGPAGGAACGSGAVSKRRRYEVHS